MTCNQSIAARRPVVPVASEELKKAIAHAKSGTRLVDDRCQPRSAIPSVSLCGADDSKFLHAEVKRGPVQSQASCGTVWPRENPSGFS
jgi:hypothetical protein